MSIFPCRSFQTSSTKAGLSKSKEGRLADGTLKFDIVNTHTHVGTHIESPYHFYFKGNTCTDYPLEHFMGTATLLTTDIAECVPRVTLEHVKQQLIRAAGLSRFSTCETTRPQRVLFNLDCVPYFASFNLKLFVFEHRLILAIRRLKMAAPFMTSC